MFGGSTRSPPCPGDSPSADRLPTGQMERDGLTLHQWRWWRQWPNSAESRSSDGENEALQVCSVQLSSGILGQGGWMVPMALVAHQEMEAGCLALLFCGGWVTAAAAVPWEQPHPLNVLCKGSEDTERLQGGQRHPDASSSSLDRNKGHQSCVVSSFSTHMQHPSQPERERHPTPCI